MPSNVTKETDTEPGAEGVGWEVEDRFPEEDNLSLIRYDKHTRG